MALGINSTIRNSMLNAISTAAGNSAVFTLYAGTRPATGGSIGSNVALVTLTASSSGFAPAAVNGTLTFNPISNGTATATGTAAWGRLTDSSTNFVFDFGVGTTSSDDLQMNSTSITSGATVSISSGTLVAGNA